MDKKMYLLVAEYVNIDNSKVLRLYPENMSKDTMQWVFGYIYKKMSFAYR